MSFDLEDLGEDFTGSRQRVVCFGQESNEPFHIFDRVDIKGRCQAMHGKPHRRGPFDGFAKNTICAHGYPAEEIPCGLETDQVIAAITRRPEDDVRCIQRGKGILNGFDGYVRHIGPDHDNPLETFPNRSSKIRSIRSCRDEPD